MHCGSGTNIRYTKAVDTGWTARLWGLVLNLVRNPKDLSWWSYVLIGFKDLIFSVQVDSIKFGSSFLSSILMYLTPTTVFTSIQFGITSATFSSISPTSSVLKKTISQRSKELCNYANHILKIYLRDGDFPTALDFFASRIKWETDFSLSNKVRAQHQSSLGCFLE